MLETLINPNQILGTGTKILNVVQIGTLTREGAVFSGFREDNYLQLGARVDKGILSLDSSTNIKDFSKIFTGDDTIEVNISFICFSQTTSSGSEEHIISGLENAKGFFYGVENDSVDKIKFYFALGLGGDTYYQSTRTNSLELGKKYYARTILIKQGNTVNIKNYINDDGQTYDNTTLFDEGTVSNPVITDMYIGILYWMQQYYLGFQGSLDFADWNIKKNGEYWWKGVETL